MTQTADELRAAKALIDTPEKWAQGDFALDGYGNSCDSDDVNATCFCILGAIGEDDNGNFADPRVKSALMKVGGFATLSAIADYNDAPETTHADIMALFDRAIAAEEVGV